MLKKTTYQFDFDGLAKALDLHSVGPEEAAAINGKTSRSFYNLKKNWSRLTVKELIGFANATGIDPQKFLICSRNKSHHLTKVSS